MVAIAVVVVTRDMRFVIVVGLVFVPASEFSFEKGGEPFGEGPVFLDGWVNIVSNGVVRRYGVERKVTNLVLPEWT